MSNPVLRICLKYNESLNISFFFLFKKNPFNMKSGLTWRKRRSGDYFWSNLYIEVVGGTKLIFIETKVKSTFLYANL